jgi:hypothetical protein
LVTDWKQAIVPTGIPRVGFIDVFYHEYLDILKDFSHGLWGVFWRQEQFRTLGHLVTEVKKACAH